MKVFSQEKKFFLSFSTFIAIYRKTKKKCCSYSLPITNQENSEKSGAKYILHIGYISHNRIRAVWHCFYYPLHVFLQLNQLYYILNFQSFKKHDL